MKRSLGPEQLLTTGYGLVPIVAGADKFTNLLVDWEKYLAPWARRLLPVKPSTFMKGVGVIEIAVGLSVLIRPTRRLGAMLAGTWLGCIALELLSSGKYFDIAARDALLAIGGFSLAQERRPVRHEGLAPGLEERPPSGLYAERHPEVPPVVAPLH